MDKVRIQDNINDVRERIERAALHAGRRPEEITLVCVSKHFPPQAIAEAMRGGLHIFGENRVQELLDKYETVRPDEWHLIGHLQTNKVKYVIDKVSLVQSVDSVRLLDEIERQAAKKEMTAHVLLQVNTSGEQSKFGASPQEIWGLLEYVAGLRHVKVQGLMTIAPLCVSPVAERLHFDNTRRLYLDIKGKKQDNVTMKYLSMGMSGDFETAIAAGSNMVRIGSGIFGSRQ